MKSMTELAGGELCLPQRPHNQVGAARRRRRTSTRHLNNCSLGQVKDDTSITVIEMFIEQINAFYYKHRQT